MRELIRVGIPLNWNELGFVWEFRAQIEKKVKKKKSSVFLFFDFSTVILSCNNSKWKLT